MCSIVVTCMHVVVGMQVVASENNPQCVSTFSLFPFSPYCWPETARHASGGRASEAAVSREREVHRQHPLQVLRGHLSGAGEAASKDGGSHQRDGRQQSKPTPFSFVTI